MPSAAALLRVVVDNRSGYVTEDLRRFVRRGLRACGVRGYVRVTFVASPIRCRGCADVGGHRMVIAVAPPSRTTPEELRRRLAAIVTHESHHLRGVEHRDMRTDLLYSEGRTPTWALRARLRYRGRAPDQFAAMRKRAPRRAAWV